MIIWCRIPTLSVVKLHPSWLSWADRRRDGWLLFVIHLCSCIHVVTFRPNWPIYHLSQFMHLILHATFFPSWAGLLTYIQICLYTWTVCEQIWFLGLVQFRIYVLDVSLNDPLVWLSFSSFIVCSVHYSSYGTSWAFVLLKVHEGILRSFALTFIVL